MRPWIMPGHARQIKKAARCIRPAAWPTRAAPSPQLGLYNKYGPPGIPCGPLYMLKVDDNLFLVVILGAAGNVANAPGPQFESLNAAYRFFGLIGGNNQHIADAAVEYL